MKICLSCVEVMLIFPAVETSIVLLYYLCLLIEKLALFIFIFALFFVHELATAIKTSKNSLYSECILLFVLKTAFNLVHPPVFLNDYGS